MLSRICEGMLKPVVGFDTQQQTDCGLLQLATIHGACCFKQARYHPHTTHQAMPHHADYVYFSFQPAPVVKVLCAVCYASQQHTSCLTTTLHAALSSCQAQHQHMKITSTLINTVSVPLMAPPCMYSPDVLQVGTAHCLHRQPSWIRQLWTQRINQ
jgi:hypothetical protein